MAAPRDGPAASYFRGSLVCDLTSLAADAMKALEGLTSAATSGWSGPAAPVRASCGPTVVRRAVANLLGNAIEFTPTTGAITVAIMERDGRARVELPRVGG